MDELSKLMEITYLLPEKKRAGVVYKSPIFGTIAISGGFLYIAQLNMMWDRNRLLMFKDTSTARFHTLFAIQHRQFDRYGPNHLKVMESLYKDGDRVLIQDADTAYDVFGVIEPLSSPMVAEMAGRCRPLNPSFPHFRDHMAELSRINPKAKTSSKK